MFDSHCHLTDPQFEPDLDGVLDRAWQAGLEGIVSIASDADDADAAWTLASRDPRIHSTAGIHPHAAASASPDALDRVRDIAARPRIVAIGETGLDYHYDNSPREAQRRVFAWHLRLAADTGRPVVVHARSADDDVAAMIRDAAGVRGILHCFSSGAALLEAALAAGWFVSFAGMVTFRRFDGADLVRRVPADRILVETDGPYLAPVPHRGRRNEPAWVVETCRAVAAHRDADPFVTASQVTANARAVYGLPAPPRGS